MRYYIYVCACVCIYSLIWCHLHLWKWLSQPIINGLLNLWWQFLHLQWLTSEGKKEPLTFFIRIYLSNLIFYLLTHANCTWCSRCFWIATMLTKWLWLSSFIIADSRDKTLIHKMSSVHTWNIIKICMLYICIMYGWTKETSECTVHDSD